MKKLLIRAVFAAYLLSTGALFAQQEITPSWSFMADATSTDGVTDFWVSQEGSSYILGQITTLPGIAHMDGLMFVKVNSAGEELWRKYIHAADTNWTLMAKGVAGDDSGNTYIVYNESYRYTDYTNNRVIIKKYNPQGNVLWTQDLTENLQGRLESLIAREVFYKNGYLYMAGSYTANLFADSDSDGLVYKVNAANGIVDEKIVYDSDYSSDDYFRQAEVDDSGNIWVIGRSRGLNGPGGIYSDYDSLIVKYDAEGNKLWEGILNGSGNSEDHGINLAIDSEGNSYTSSQVKQIGVNQRLVVIRKYSSAGQVIWTHNFQGSSSGHNYKQPVKVLPNGNVVFVTSNEDGINTVVLNGAAGTQVWAANYNRSGAGAANHQRDAIVDSEGNIIITGVSRDNTPFGAGYDMVTLSYSSTGEMNWLSNFNHGNYDTMGDDGVVLRQDSTGNIYAIGWTQEADFNDDFLLLKYGSAVMGMKDNLSGDIKLYPNPANDFTFLSLQEGMTADNVMLHDMNGRIIKDWKGFELSGNVRLDLDGVSKGIYLLTVKSGAALSSFKIIKK